MSMTEQTPAPAAPQGPITLDQFAEELTREQEAAAAKASEPEAPPPPEKVAAGEEDAVDLEAPPQSDDEDEPALDLSEDEEAEAAADEEEDAAAIPDPPQSWSKEDREAWKDLTPKAREIVLRREKDRDTAVAKAVQTASEAVKWVQQEAARTKEIEHLAVDQFEAKWQENAKGPINWAQWLAQAQTQDEFQQITLQKAQYEADKAELERVKKLAGEREVASHRAFIAEQSQKLAEIAPELVDPDKGPARREKVFGWLEQQGVAKEDFRWISAAELKIAWKAMRFDEAEAKAKAQASLPRKAPPPAKPVRAAGTGEPSTQRNLQALSQKLTKSGTLDAFVELMNAEEEARSRKARRQ